MADFGDKITCYFAMFAGVPSGAPDVPAGATEWVIAQDTTTGYFYYYDLLTSTWAYLSTRTLDYINIQDQETSGTDGGTFTSGAWQTRVLNTIEADSGSHVVSLSSNQFALPAGTYRARIECPCVAVGRHQAQLYNVTDSTVTLTGTSSYAASPTGDVVESWSFITGRFTIAAQKTFAVQHRCTNTHASNGFGANAGVGFTVPHEAYTVVELWKE